MFDFKKDKQLNNQVSNQNATIAEKNALADLTSNAEKNNFDAKDIKVHSMPEKFLTGGYKKIITTSGVGQVSGASISGHKKSLLIGLLIGVLVLAILALGGWFLIKSIEQPTSTAETNNVISTAKEEVVTNTTTEEVVPEKKCSADTCGNCNPSECLDLEDSCHLEDLCLTTLSSNASTDNCPNYVCATGPLVQEKTDLSSETEKLTLAKDSDNDGLTDVEEGLWGTDPLKEDTDGDKYSDGHEVENLYSPIKAGSGNDAKLTSSSLVKNYTNNKFGYSLLYPSSWTVEDLKNNGEEVMFKATNGDFIEVIAQKLTTEYPSAKDWYLDQDSNINADQLSEVLIGNWSGVQSPNGLSIYLIRNNYLYALTHNIGLHTELTYQATFNFIQKSFKFFESPL